METFGDPTLFDGDLCPLTYTSDLAVHQPIHALGSVDYCLELTWGCR